MLSTSTLLFALLGGILPALLWLWFWLREDRKNPEPRGFIMLSFVAGMVAVPLVIPLQKFVDARLVGVVVLILWAAIEEVLKLGAAYLTVLRSKQMDEPIDAVIYMITVALGFTAVENILFLLAPLSNGFVVDSILTGNMRFLGASLIHVLSSATIGVAMALAFYKRPVIKKLYALVGVILAIALHALFNFFIMRASGGIDKVLTIFLFVWIGIIILLLLFEKVKTIVNPRLLFIRKKK